MANSKLLTGLVLFSSAILRFAAYFFLQWIPGHHGPPAVIVGALIYFVAVYLWEYPSSTADTELPPPEKPEDASRDRNPDATRSLATPSPIWTRFRTLFLGVPDEKHQTLTWITIGINVLLVSSVLDFVVRSPLLYPSDDLRFSRVGHVSWSSAKILIREPAPSTDPLELVYSAAGLSSSQKIILDHPTDATDFTRAITLTQLQPETTYRYEVSNNLTGVFTTAARPGTRQAENLTFVTSSCQKANWPYQPQRHPLAFPGFSYLSNVLQALPSPASFMLFLGDFIYVDVPFRLGTTVSHYRSEYRRVYASPSWSLSQALQSLPWIHTLDDHEIENDWSSGNMTAPFPAASDPFWHYHVSVNPPIPVGASPDNTTYFTFTQGPASFFMVDTRRYRTHPEPNPQATMLGSRQLQDLLAYITKPEPKQVKWKIIASSVPFTKNWRVGTTDTWGGFLKERAIVLEAMHKAETTLGVRIVVLSGDRHEFGAVRFPGPGSTTNTSGPHEYSVGPLSQFYLPARTFKQTGDEDVVLSYIPDGNFKFGLVDIVKAPKNDSKIESILKYTLYIDGKVAWEHMLSSPAPEYLAAHRGWGFLI